MSKLSRRRFIFTAGATAVGTAILHGCATPNNTATSPSPAGSPAASPVAGGETPEVTTAKLGFIALTDSAPLIIAKEKGLFTKHGMPDVQVMKQASWAATRDNLELGSAGNGIDGAHILSPMPYLMTTGKITKQPVPMYILARLNTNGQAISISKSHADLKLDLDSSRLKETLTKAKSAGKEMKAAVTFPGGNHDLFMRYWLSAGGIDPNNDISLIVVPPPQMVANMKVGTMDAFCVGEPWNAQLVSKGLGYTALITGEFWKDHPEKAFAMRADWVEKHPQAAKAITMAIIEAQQWCDDPANTKEMCEIISKREWLKIDPQDILGRAQGNIDFGNGRKVENSPVAMKFWRDNASYPYKSHDTWFVTEDIRWGYIPADTDIKALVDKVNREDIWREAATALNVPADQIPTSTSRGVETFFDGVKFDPENPQAYLDSLKIKKI
ncbi:MAG: ABC transporter substrate-binding protein [Microcystis aeruginosa LL13-03]|jgi:nitrate/nitrite transport system substrate-binding protein|nr:ABC transporter substrate-binding protein [Microcystis aeruginosa SX13-11]NCR16986.1 ABC transporter substrate-binding protein [Microcystis aeruginosa LL13-03]NCR45208.1 ABC transporter substrate-binding protein [Microcystis aeruginosa SX13-01]NCR66983.1 ABC transporter substrate-binding protein [Microcystis aeruginosa LL11-07]NCR90377.1 ABC transporter substrate-binding protein [Microcystis aeruginosa G13-10]NCS16775.1 ABC transporter substrate-binding protein [Microcystis aeruginosa G13-1